MIRQGLAAAVLAIVACALGALVPECSLAADSVLLRRAGIDPSATDRIIVKWRDSGVAAVQIPSVADRATRLSNNTGVAVTAVRNLYGQVDVMRLDHVMSHSAMLAVLARLRTDPGVAYAEADALRFIEQQFPSAAPNDPHFVAGSDAYGSWDGQWYLQPSSSSTPAAISATGAWLKTTGSSSVVVAVIDTGVVLDHPDLLPTASGGKLLPGYDFVSCDQGNSASAPSVCSASGSAATYYIANDNGLGWNQDASDPGDWISSADIAMSLFQADGCTTVEPSSWHGTKVAGVIGAITNNGIGIAGIAPDTLILPVRAIGVCTGRVSDIAAAITWAAGMAVTGVPSLSAVTGIDQANIINLSLGAPMACSATEQDAISAAIGAGVLVVAAAGNEGGPVDAPASCPGVLSVAGLRHTGTKVGYSSLSSSAAAVSIAAPAGNCVNVGTTVPCVYSIETTSDAGATTPASTPGFYTYALLDSSYLNGGGNADNQANVGTSFAAPMASGVAALMLATSPTLTPSELIARMQSSALGFPTSSSTTSTTCVLASTTTDSNGNFTDTSQDIECVCTTATCGAGMLNAEAAVTAASGLFVQITPSSSTGSPGQHITLNGSGSTPATGDTIVSYQWTTIPATSNQLINANQAIATLVVPTFRSIQVELTITDSGGNVASGTVTIQSAFGAASGVGSFGPELLALAALTGATLRRRRRAMAAVGRVLN
jgi:serine protease